MSETLSVIVPCFNEEAALPHFYREICRVAGEMPQLTFELLFADDGSSDGTLPFLRQLARADSRVRYLSFSRNFGKEAAMYAGFTHCTGDYAAVMDADLQDPPQLLKQMYGDIKKGDFDCIATRRATRKGEPPLRSFFSKMFTAFST